MIDSFPPATFVPVTVSNGHVVCESLLGSTVGTERSVFPPIPLSEIEHGAYCISNNGSEFEIDKFHNMFILNITLCVTVFLCVCVFF